MEGPSDGETNRGETMPGGMNHGGERGETLIMMTVGSGIEAVVPSGTAETETQTADMMTAVVEIGAGALIGIGVVTAEEIGVVIGIGRTMVARSGVEGTKPAVFQNLYTYLVLTTVY